MRTRLAAVAATALLASALTSVPASSAVLPDCTTPHCYGIAHYSEGEFTAVGQELWTDCLVLPNNYTDIATHEMWLLFPDGNTKWLEAGYIKGYAAGGDTNTQFRYFYAQYDGTTFTSQSMGNAPITYYSNFSFYKNPSGSWGVYLNGVYKGTTLSTVYGNSDYVQTGGETSDPYVYSHGKSRWLQTRSAATGSWNLAIRDYWNATPDVYDVSVDAYERMEQISLPNICDPLPGGPPGTFAAAQPPTLEKVKASVLKWSAMNGEKSPTAELVTSKGDAGETYLVQMRGKFVGNMATRPKGYKAPTGTVMTVEIDKATGDTVSWSLGKDAKDLAKLGKVTKF